MELTLMNKNTPVLDMEFSLRRGGFIQEIETLHNPEYAPLGLVDDDKNIDEDALSDWWEGRCLPDSRLNVEKILEALQLSKQELIINSLGLSLSDQYWVKPVGSGTSWEEVNFFQNEFSNKVGKLFFEGTTQPDSDADSLRSFSPDYSSNGFLDKYWTIEEGERVLVKGGHGAFYQQPYNEVVASNMLKKLSCKNYVPYTLAKTSKGVVSKCHNFVTEDTEYVPASLIRRRLPLKKGDSYYSHFLRCCKELGFEQKMKCALDYMLTFDYVIANEDRNYGNFGVIRNVETLKVLGVAPIFDNGNSLWYDKENISHKDIKAYPFELTQGKQIRHVHSGVFPFDRLGKCAKDIIYKELSKNPNCSENRIEMIARAVQKRCTVLLRHREPYFR